MLGKLGKQSNWVMRCLLSPIGQFDRDSSCEIEKQSYQFLNNVVLSNSKCYRSRRYVRDPVNPSEMQADLGACSSFLSTFISYKVNKRF